MSKLACAIDPPSAGYPPIRYSEEDQAGLARIQALKAKAPYGTDPNGRSINEFDYKLRVHKRAKAAKALKLGWPFWAGIGAGGVAALSLFFSRKS